MSSFVASIDKTITYHGFENADYALDSLRQLAGANDDKSRLRLELLVTDTLLRLAHNLHGDNINLGELYVGWKFHRTNVDVPAVMEKAVADVIAEGKYVTYDLKPNRDDPTAVGTREMADAIIRRLK